MINLRRPKLTVIEVLGNITLAYGKIDSFGEVYTKVVCTPTRRFVSTDEVETDVTY
jgi:hypothetical protein